MTDTSSLADWIEAVQNGVENSLRMLWDRFDRRFIERAYSWLQQITIQTREFPEYRSLPPIDSLFAATRGQTLPKQRGENEFWRILAIVAHQQHADELLAANEAGDRIQVFAALMGPECLRMINLLADSELEAMVLWRLEGMTNDVIATKLSYTRRTVQRMMKLVREIWEYEIESDDDEAVSNSE